MTGWTYGAEHELADWCTEEGLPEGFSRAGDWTLVNSNGIAVQPNPSVYKFGGEINTPPTDSVEGQCDCLHRILEMHPSASVNYRSNLHLHIRVPGIKDDLKTLKAVQKYIHEQLRKVISRLEPIPQGRTPGEKKRSRRRRVSHQTFLSDKRLRSQLAASSLSEFFEREVPTTKQGAPMWHAQPRVSVNLRQLLQTDTIEFRHFPGTLSVIELGNCLRWCKSFLEFAILGRDILRLWRKFSPLQFPKFPEYDYATEVRYQATASHGGFTAGEARQNIAAILEGRFNGTEAEKKARKLASGVPRKHLQEPS